MDDQLKLLALIFARADALNFYWNLYLALVLGLLGLMASGKPFTARVSIKLLLSVGFIGVALSNLGVIDAIDEQRRQLLILLGDCPAQAVASAAMPPERWRVGAFHLGLDVLVLICIWFVPWHRVRPAARGFGKGE
ncbi:hypothetical protein [Niveibacterium terrae]|uniref:hypothetical protein n=1 Tax=Niveibacterium terrae TaxID=3373598 RepID=UPI003A8D9F59